MSTNFILVYLGFFVIAIILPRLTLGLSLAAILVCVALDMQETRAHPPEGNQLIILLAILISPVTIVAALSIGVRWLNAKLLKFGRK